MMNAQKILTIVLAGLAGIILLQNTQVMSLQILFWQFTMSRILFLLLILLLGVGIGYLLARNYGR